MKRFTWLSSNYATNFLLTEEAQNKTTTSGKNIAENQPSYQSQSSQCNTLDRLFERSLNFDQCLWTKDEHRLRFRLRFNKRPITLNITQQNLTHPNIQRSTMQCSIAQPVTIQSPPYATHACNTAQHRATEHNRTQSNNTTQHSKT